MALKFGTIPPTAGTDAVTVANNAAFQDLQAFTVLMWMLPTALDNLINGETPLWTKGTGVGAKQFYVDGVNGNIHVQISRATVSANARSTSLVKLNEWQFVGFTFDATNGIKIYHGFERVTSSKPIFADVTTGEPDPIGSGAVTADGNTALVWGGFSGQAMPWNGLLEMSGLWNRVLTRQQMLQQMQQMYPSEGCVNMYQFGTPYGINGNQKDLSKFNLPGVMTGKLASNILNVSPKVPVALANQRDG